MKKVLIICLLSGIALPTWALNKKKSCIYQTTSEAGISISSNGKLSSFSLSANQFWQPGKNQKHLRVGLGARLTSSLGGKNLNYTTAPADLTTGKSGLGSFFSNKISENIDTLSLTSTQVNTFNAVLFLRYEFTTKWSVDFNLDLAGFSFGSSKSSTLTYGEHSDATRKTNAKPSPRNVLLFSDYDRGSLCSELMLSYLYRKDVRIKVGLSSLHCEYTIENPVLYTSSAGTVIGTDRYRIKSLCFGVGVNYIFKQKNK